MCLMAVRTPETIVHPAVCNALDIDRVAFDTQVLRVAQDLFSLAVVLYEIFTKTITAATVIVMGTPHECSDYAYKVCLDSGLCHRKWRGVAAHPCRTVISCMLEAPTHAHVIDWLHRACRGLLAPSNLSANRSFAALTHPNPACPC
jgi:hypothetical protein